MPASIETTNCKRAIHRVCKIKISHRSGTLPAPFAQRSPHQWEKSQHVPTHVNTHASFTQLPSSPLPSKFLKLSKMKAWHEWGHKCNGKFARIAKQDNYPSNHRLVLQVLTPNYLSCPAYSFWNWWTPIPGGFHIICHFWRQIEGPSSCCVLLSLTPGAKGQVECAKQDVGWILRTFCDNCL